MGQFKMHEYSLIPVLHGIEREQFFNEIVPQQKPVIIKGLINSWACVREVKNSPLAIFDYLNSFYSGKKLRVFLGDPSIKGRLFYSEDMRSLNFTASNETLDKFFDLLLRAGQQVEPPMVAIQSASLNGYFPGFVESNSLDFFDSNIEPNIWLGGKVTVCAHYDSSDNLACVITGRRRFILFPPDQVSNLYPGPLDFTPAGAPVSLVSLHNPDFERYPRFKNALEHAQMAELKPGDAIFIPMLWWHHVDSLEPINGLVNYWWSGAIANPKHKPTPLESLGFALLAMRNLSPTQKKAWQAIFMHYLFRSDIDPVDYIPDHALGILGDVSPDLEKKIKEWYIEQLKTD